MNLYDAITYHRSWTELQCSMGVLTMCEQIDAFLLLIDEMHVAADGLDEEVERQISGKIDNVVVLSKHYSSSGRPAMTVHPIGVTSGGSIGERGMSGGRFGTLVPPHPKIAHVIRALLRAADNQSKLMDSTSHWKRRITAHCCLLPQCTLRSGPLPPSGLIVNWPKYGWTPGQISI